MPGASATGRSRTSAGGTGGPTRGRALRTGPDNLSATGFPPARNPPAARALSAGPRPAFVTPAPVERRGGAGGPTRGRDGDVRAGIARAEPEPDAVLDSARETSPPETSKNKTAHRQTLAQTRLFGFQVALLMIR